MRLSLALLLGLLLALHPRFTQAQGHQIAHVVPTLDLYVGLPLVSAALERPALDRAGGGVARGRGGVELMAENERWKVPIRAPYALPSPAFTLFVPAYLRAVTPSVPAPEPGPDVAAVALEAETMPAVHAGTVQARSETTYYEVSGKSRAAIAAALRQHGPRIQGTQFFGLTEWKVSAEYRPTERAAGCGIDDLTVHVAVQTHLPRWTPAAGAPADLDRAWDRFVTALDEHEHGHRALAEEAADAIRQRLATVRTPACDQLDPVAHQEMIGVMKEYESRNIAYDRATGHGRTQGAVWPPRVP